jgi:hypothetical protein
MQVLLKLLLLLLLLLLPLQLKLPLLHMQFLQQALEELALGFL